MSRIQIFDQNFEFGLWLWRYSSAKLGEGVARKKGRGYPTKYRQPKRKNLVKESDGNSTTRFLVGYLLTVRPSFIGPRTLEDGFFPPVDVIVGPTLICKTRDNVHEVYLRP